MKKLLQGLKCGSIMVNSWNLLMCFLLLSYNIGVNARNFDYNVKHQRKRNVVEPPSCDSVKHFFESMNVTIVSQLSSGDNRNGKCFKPFFIENPLTTPRTVYPIHHYNPPRKTSTPNDSTLISLTSSTTTLSLLFSTCLFINYKCRALDCKFSDEYIFFLPNNKNK